MQVALREIRNYQKGVDLLIPKARFQAVVRELADTVASMGKGAWGWVRAPPPAPAALPILTTPALLPIIT